MNYVFTMFEKLADPFELVPNPNPLMPPVQPLRFVFAILSNFSWLTIAFASLAALVAVMETLMLWGLGSLVDVLRRYPDTNFDMLIFFGVLVALRPAVGFLYLLLKNQSFNPTLGTVTRLVFHRYVVGHSPSFFNDAVAGRVAAKVMQTGSAVRQGMRIAIDHIWSGTISFVLTLGLLATVDWRFAPPILTWLVLYLWVLWIWVPRNQRAADLSAEALSKLNGSFIDVYNNFVLSLMFASRRCDAVESSLRSVLEVIRRQTRVATSAVVLIWLLNSGLVLAVGGLAVWLWSLGTISVGSVAGAVAILARLQNMSLQILYSLNTLSSAMGTLGNSMRTISRPHAITDVNAPLPFLWQAPGIVFREVTALVGKEKRSVLSSLDLMCPPGETLFLVGPSGQGKSTILSLVCRFIEPNSGSIEISGVNVSDIDQSQLRQNISAAFQIPQIFAASIRENLSIAKPSLKDCHMIRALDAVQLWTRVSNLTDMKGNRGLAVQIGEGTPLLSGGELQRLALARVLLGDAPIALLDEPTSAQDPETESEIWPEIRSRLAGRTTIIVTHRLSLLTPTSLVAFVDGGCVTASGPLSEVLQASTRFKAFFEAERSRAQLSVECTIER